MAKKQAPKPLLRFGDMVQFRHGRDFQWNQRDRLDRASSTLLRDGLFDHSSDRKTHEGETWGGVRAVLLTHKQILPIVIVINSIFFVLGNYELAFLVFDV